VPASLASVDHVEVLEREAQLACKLFDPFSQFALRQRVELVEERLDCKSAVWPGADGHGTD